MAKFSRGHAANKKVIASCAASGVGIEGLEGAPRFRFVPIEPPADKPRNSFTNGEASGKPSARGTYLCGKPKPKNLRNWSPARTSMDPNYTIAMAGDDWRLTVARREYADGKPGKLRAYLAELAEDRRNAALAAEAQTWSIAA